MTSSKIKKKPKNGNLRTAGPFLGCVGLARFGLHTGTSASLCGRNPLRVVGLCRDTATGRARAAASGVSSNRDNGTCDGTRMSRSA